MYKQIYKGKKVLVTGHTGFKGTWLSLWLTQLGAEVFGISNGIPTTPSMFQELKIEKIINHNVEDVRNLNKIKELIEKVQPDFIFHLAAQAIVSESYEDPISTISTNVIGTANILESIRSLQKKCAAVIITSDKCYENVEQIWGYKENDQVGGKDIYSGSKGCAELVFHSYYHSFLKNENPNLSIATARAGNVIGGGDWAKDRIVVDCVVAWSLGKKVNIRSPKATRPWQHVLEPLSGYLTLGANLYQKDKLRGESFNFGPKAEQNHTVLELLKDLSRYWSFSDDNSAFEVTDDIKFHEAGLLKLNCDKALHHLKWQSNLNYQETMKFVSLWYYNFYNKDMDMLEFTANQIDDYQNLAKARNLGWAQV